MILESGNCLSTFSPTEGGTRRHSIVPNESSRLQPIVDLLREWLDINLVEVNFIASDLVSVSTAEVR